MFVLELARDLPYLASKPSHDDSSNNGAKLS